MTENISEVILSSETLKKDFKNSHDNYRLVAREVGCDVYGINLNANISKEVIDTIKRDVITYRILIFKDQGLISGARHIEIAKWFGEPDGPFDKHEKVPTPDIMRIHNDVTMGPTNMDQKWHIEQSYKKLPYCYSLYQIVSAANREWTIFPGLTEIVYGLSPEKRDRWERLYMFSDRHERPIHPLIYTHPVSKKRVICYDAEKIITFVWDYGTDNSRTTEPKETKELLAEINEEFNKKECIYFHQWKEGELLIKDNLSVGQDSSCEHMMDENENGVMIMQCVSTRGTYRPKKQY